MFSSKRATLRACRRVYFTCTTSKMKKYEEHVLSVRSFKECPSMPQSDHVAFPLSSLPLACLLAAFRRRGCDLQIVQVWKLGTHLAPPPAMTIMLWGKSSGKYGKVMRSTGFGAIHGYPVDKTRSWDFLWLWRPPHICPCTQEASKTRQKPRGKSLSCQLGEPCYSCTSPKHSKNLGSKCSAHAVSEVTIFGEGLSSKASPTRKQWSMQTCQINPNHASRLKKIAPEPKNTSN